MALDRHGLNYIKYLSGYWISNKNYTADLWGQITLPRFRYHSCLFVPISTKDQTDIDIAILLLTHFDIKA